jgi:hypothetical protein
VRFSQLLKWRRRAKRTGHVVFGLPILNFRLWCAQDKVDLYSNTYAGIQSPTDFLFKKDFYSTVFFSIFGHQNPGSGSGFGSVSGSGIPLNARSESRSVSGIKESGSTTLLVRGFIFLYGA